jgi:uncharacterized membrane protein (UPF0182 family)
MLRAWRAAFPDTVLDREEIPDELLDHLRYPEDLFKVQRYQFARYHVTDPGTFYQKDAWWEVPSDPEQAGKLQPPYRLFVQDPDTGVDKFSLTSVYVPYNKNNLAAFVSVDSDATSPETYGRIQVLQLPNENIPGPGNIANEMQSDPDVTEALLPLTQGGSSRVTYGNLLTLPVTGGLMYVQPIYATRQLSDASYPILRYVTVSYGDRVGIGNTLERAIIDVLGGDEPPPPDDGGDGGEDNPPDDGGGNVPTRVRNLLAQAEQDFKAADAAFEAGNVGEWARLMEDGRQKVDQAITILNERNGGTGGSAGEGEEPPPAE